MSTRTADVIGLLWYMCLTGTVLGWWVGGRAGGLLGCLVACLLAYELKLHYQTLVLFVSQVRTSDNS